MKAIYNRIPGSLWLFFSFMFLQLTLLGLGNHAGEGYLSTMRREKVYFMIQLFVIGGYLAFFAENAFLKQSTVRSLLQKVFSAMLLFCSVVMPLADKGSAFYLAVTFLSCFGLGCLGGAVSLKMCSLTAADEPIALSMGGGMSGAILFQYLFSLRWGQSPLLIVLLPASLVLTLFMLNKLKSSDTKANAANDRAYQKDIVFACLIAASLLLLASFYNLYIHHMQIKSGYTDYNVYSWPRLMMIPCYLLFACIGDKRNGRLVPLTALCIALAGMLNCVLIGTSGTYWLNMCIFYFSLAAAVSYYYITFWRIAPLTRFPALWAPMGRIMDSVMVLVTAGIKLSSLSAPMVLGLNLGGLVLTIVLLAVSGGFDLSADRKADTVPAMLSADAALERLREQFALTPRETQIFRELVTTEDKQTVISERLSITVKGLQKYVTSLYRKTGTTTRSGLTDLFHRTMTGK